MPKKHASDGTGAARGRGRKSTYPPPCLRASAVGALLVAALPLAAVSVPAGFSPTSALQPAPVALPANSLFVSPSGSDSAAGTLAAPLKTIKKAISTAFAGRSIVVRGGTYPESLVVPEGKPLRISAYPEERVWLEGSRAVDGFTRSGNGYVLDGWTIEFDSSPTYDRGAPDGKEPGWGFVNPNHPMAAHPDQVWIDGVAQVQVKSLAQLRTGTFYADYRNDRLHVGTDPAGRNVRASDKVRALAIRAAGTTIDGLNVRRFAPSVPDMGAVTVERGQVALRNMTIVDNATTGLNVDGTDVVLDSLTLERNGMLGASMVYADRLSVIGMRSSGNNTERFNSSPVAGGAKIGRSRGVTVRNSAFKHNLGTGLWLDESVYDGRIVGNDMVGNSGHGISLEISAKMKVVDNVVVGNGATGIKVNGTSDVSIWNNTVSGPGRTLNIVQDARRAADRGTPGHDPRQPFPDPTMTWINKNIRISNNLLSSTGKSGKCVLCVEDYSHTFSAEQMKLTALGNVYHRASATVPQWTAVWSNGPGNPSVHTSLASFVKAEKQEAKSHELLGATPLDSVHRPTTSVSVQTARVAQPLPGDLAGLAGVAEGSKRLGAFPR